MPDNDLTREQREVVREIIRDTLKEVSTLLKVIQDVIKKFPEDIQELTNIVTILKTESHNYDTKINGIGNSLDKRIGEVHERITKEVKGAAKDSKDDDGDLAGAIAKTNERIDTMWIFFIGTVVLEVIGGILIAIFAR